MIGLEQQTRVLRVGGKGLLIKVPGGLPVAALVVGGDPQVAPRDGKARFEPGGGLPGFDGPLVLLLVVEQVAEVVRGTPVFGIGAPGGLQDDQFLQPYRETQVRWLERGFAVPIGPFGGSAHLDGKVAQGVVDHRVGRDLGNLEGFGRFRLAPGDRAFQDSAGFLVQAGVAIIEGQVEIVLMRIPQDPLQFAGFVFGGFAEGLQRQHQFVVRPVVERVNRKSGSQGLDGFLHLSQVAQGRRLSGCGPCCCWRWSSGTGRGGPARA